MDATTTRVPKLVDALFAMAVRVLPSDVLVLDGPALPAEPAPRLVLIGVGNDENADPYRSSRSIEGYDGTVETGVVRCQAAVVSGDLVDPGASLFKAGRDLLATYLDTLAAELHTDPHLAETVDYVELGDLRWLHIATGEGPLVGVDFDIRYRALL